MAEPISIVLVGVSGYGAVYLSALLDEPLPLPVRIAALVDPCHAHGVRPKTGGVRRDADGPPRFASLEEYYDALGRSAGAADLVIVSSPIHLHASQTCLALGHGSHVLCEKPAAATIDDVDRMRRAQAGAARFVAVGFQWSFFRSVQRLKADIMAGLFGAPRRFKSLCFWPRDTAYYTRNDWAGRLRTAGGAIVLDSPVNNAMAHFVHHMLYLLGDSAATSARPARLTAELYRANGIETFDTAALRAETDTGVEIMFYCSHAVPNDHGPVFVLDFEKASLVYDGGDSPVIARFADGRRTEYASPESEPEFTKLWTCLEAIAGGRGQEAIPCGLDAARAHTLCVRAAHDSTSVVDFPAALIRETPSGTGRLLSVDGLAEIFQECFERSLMPSELGPSWTRPGAEIEIEGS